MSTMPDEKKEASTTPDEKKEAAVEGDLTWSGARPRGTYRPID